MSPMTPTTDVLQPADAGPAPGLVGRWRFCWGLVLEALGVAWLPWLTARVITLFALGFAKYALPHFHITNSKAVLESHDGLLGSSHAGRPDDRRPRLRASAAVRHPLLPAWSRFSTEG